MELRRADVVCVVYAVDDEDSLDSVTDHWLPFIQRTLGERHTTPVILVGNKVNSFVTAHHITLTKNVL
jgi:Ras family protein T1